jgi:hypothetical protein
MDSFENHFHFGSTEGGHGEVRIAGLSVPWPQTTLGFGQQQVSQQYSDNEICTQRTRRSGGSDNKVCTLFRSSTWET